MTHAPACPLILPHVCGDYHPAETGALIVGVSAGGSACRTTGEGGGRETLEGSEMKTARLVTGPDHHIRLRSL